MVSLTLKYVEELALLLPAEQRQELIVRLSRSIATRSESSESLQGPPVHRRPQRLYGDWKGKFPEDFDVDAALREIREQWTRNDAA